VPSPPSSFLPPSSLLSPPLLPPFPSSLLPPPSSLLPPPSPPFLNAPACPHRRPRSARTPQRPARRRGEPRGILRLVRPADSASAHASPLPSVFASSASASPTPALSAVRPPACPPSDSLAPALALPVPDGSPVPFAHAPFGSLASAPSVSARCSGRGRETSRARIAALIVTFIEGTALPFLRSQCVGLPAATGTGRPRRSHDLPGSHRHTLASAQTFQLTSLSSPQPPRILATCGGLGAPVPKARCKPIRPAR
jgi:hypothetical protein